MAGFLCSFLFDLLYSVKIRIQRWAYLDVRRWLVRGIRTDASTQPEEVFHRSLLLCSCEDIAGYFQYTHNNHT